MKWLWPYSDFLRLFPWILDDFLDFLAGVRMVVVFVLQLLMSQLAPVHWPVALLSSGELHLRHCLLLQAFLFWSSSCSFWLSMVQHLRCCLTQNVHTCSAGAATMFFSGRTKLFWKFAVVNTVFLYCVRLCLGHLGALLFPGDGAIDVFALSALVGLLCMPVASMRHSLRSGVRSAVQRTCARFGYRRHCHSIDRTTANWQPLHRRSLSIAVSGEFSVTDADTASTPGICITADGSTAPHQALHHPAGFSDSSQMPKAPVSGSNEATASSLQNSGYAVMHGTSSRTHSIASSTEADHPNLVCFWLGKHGKSTNCSKEASPCMLCLCWCVSLLSHCSRQHCAKYVHVLPSLSLLYHEPGLPDINETAHVVVAGASCGNVIRLISVVIILRAVSMVARLAQRIWCSMQRVQLCVQGVNAGFQGLWEPESSSLASASPLTETQASVSAAAILQASSAAHKSPRSLHQSMAQQFRSGGPPSARLLPPHHSTAGYSSPAMQQDRVAGGHGNVGAAVPDQDMASDGESEVFEEADAILQIDLLHMEAPLQVKAAASCVHRG